MTTERAFYPHNQPQPPRRRIEGDTGLLPSRRVVVPPSPGTDAGDFLDDLNEIYGSEIPEDDQVIEGARRTLRDLLDRTP